LKENVSRKTKKEKNFCTPQKNKWCLSHSRERKRVGWLKYVLIGVSVIVQFVCVVVVVVVNVVLLLLLLVVVSTLLVGYFALLVGYFAVTYVTLSTLSVGLLLLPSS
jgi:uncharacterized membrane protein